MPSTQRNYTANKKRLVSDMQGGVVQLGFDFKRKAMPKKYVPGLIEEYIAERDQNWLNGNPGVDEETRLAILNKRE